MLQIVSRDCSAYITQICSSTLARIQGAMVVVVSVLCVILSQTHATLALFALTIQYLIATHVSLLVKRVLRTLAVPHAQAIQI